jgi:hypothetical protein
MNEKTQDQFDASRQYLALKSSDQAGFLKRESF